MTDSNTNNSKKDFTAQKAAVQLNKRFHLGLKKTTFGIISVFVFSMLFAVTNTQAQESGGIDLTVSPPVLELVAKPGETITERFRVRNNGTEKINLQVKARRLISDPQNGSPVPEDIESGEELKWVSFSENTFTARPREWTDVTFTISIPESAAHGYYYVFRISPTNDNDASITGAKVKGEILVVALLTVKKDGAKTETEIAEFKADKFITEYLPTDFTVTVKNKGNVHVKPRGNIFIKRGSGEEISILEINSGLGSVLPGGTREFKASWNDGFITKEPVIKNDTVVLDENGKPVTNLKINWNRLTEFRVGPYNAKIFMVYDDGTRDVTLESTTTFWVIPYTALGIILGGIVILIIILRFTLKWYIKRAITKSKKR